MRPSYLLLLSPFLILGCGKPREGAAPTVAANPAPSKPSLNLAQPGDDPAAVAVLQRSLEVYGQAVTLQFDSEKVRGTQRVTSTLLYQQPNFFKLTVHADGNDLTSVCNGSSTLEFDTKSGLAPRLDHAPPHIMQVASMQMTHPVYGGSLIYQFLGGTDNYKHLVDNSRGPVTSGPEETVNGEQARHVRFVGGMVYGHVDALIGEKTGYVYRLSCDLAPMKEIMANSKFLAQIHRDAGSKSPDGAGLAADALLELAHNGNLASVETFTNIQTPATVPDGTFSCATPSGQLPVDLTATQDLPKSPIPIGKAAPDIVVRSLSGQTIHLSELKGHPVMLDFWATWCGPCKASLPHTQEMADRGKASGLEVIAISAEERAPVAAFIKENGYTFQTAIDAGGSASHAFGTQVIPTTVVIDRQGNLAAYLVGGGIDDEIESALKNVGVKL